MGPRLPAAVRPMAQHNLGYLHWCNIPSKSCDDFYLEEIRNVCRSAAAVGFEGLDTYDELSDQRPNVEIFYLAWEAFPWDSGDDNSAVRRATARPALWRIKGSRPALGNHPVGGATPPSGKVWTTARRPADWPSRGGIASPEGRSHWDRLIATLSRHQRAAQPRQTPVQEWPR